MAYIRNRYLFLSDFLLLAAAPFVAYAIRLEALTWSPADGRTALLYSGSSLLVKLGIFVLFGLYGRLWSRASMPDLQKILEAGTAAAVACALLGLFVLPASGLTPLRVPISVSILDAFVTVTVVAAPRLLLRALGPRRQWAPVSSSQRALIVGAGAAGEMILRELTSNPQLDLNPVGFVDDDPTKQNHRLHGVPVLGPLSALPGLIARHGIEEIVIAMPTAPGKVVRSVVRAAADARIPTRTVPALFEILSGRVSLSNLRKVEIQDLLRREPVRTDLALVRSMVSRRPVLVTGAGGSIGSELARQLAQLGPERLALLGNGENEIFDIVNELKEAHPGLQLSAVIADVRDPARIRSVFQRLRPHAVFHAAAHKHVPLMEDNVADAVTNNVLGTRNVVDCGAECGTQHFVLISTDKAVRPTSVMGATKRVAEMVVQQAAMRYRRNFVSVRFGNVLGSRCSVVPIFLGQIRAGGPVSITHPEMRRYFMTIPEAVQLVLQAGALGRGGEVFVLDMGEPIRIVDLATDLVRLSGLEVGRDIEIRYTGIRPGERLYEEPFFRHEEALVEEHREQRRATPGARVGRVHVPSSSTFSERRAWADRRAGDRRAHTAAVLAERRAGERRRGVERRLALSIAGTLVADRVTASQLRSAT